MTPRMLLEASQSEFFQWIDYDINNTPVETGEMALIQFDPPISDSALRTFQQAVQCPLPQEIEDLLSFCTGFTLLNSRVCFVGLPHWGLRFVLPNALGIMDDGSGNVWAVDIDSHSGEWRSVWYVCHDPPVIGFQCKTMTEFIQGVLDQYRMGRQSTMQEIHKKSSGNWRSLTRLPKAKSLRKSLDPNLREFAGQLSGNERIADLRQPCLGVGFDWSSASPSYPIKRAGEELIFAIPQSRGILRRILGEYVGEMASVVLTWGIAVVGVILFIAWLMHR